MQKCPSCTTNHNKIEPPQLKNIWQLTTTYSTTMWSCDGEAIRNHQMQPLQLLKLDKIVNTLDILTVVKNVEQNWKQIWQLGDRGRKAAKEDRDLKKFISSEMAHRDEVFIRYSSKSNIQYSYHPTLQCLYHPKWHTEIRFYQLQFSHRQIPNSSIFKSSIANHPMSNHQSFHPIIISSAISLYHPKSIWSKMTHPN